MTLTEALEFLVDYVDEDGFAAAELVDDLWHSPDFLKAWDPVMADAILHGKLSQTYWDEVCGDVPLGDFLVSLAKLWDVLTKNGVVYPLKDVDTFTPEITVKIWAYVEYWETTIDELFLSDYFQLFTLLELATDPTCPKRDLCQEGILSILREVSRLASVPGQQQRTLPKGISTIENMGAQWLVSVYGSNQIFQISSDEGKIQAGVRLDNRILLV